MKHELMNMTDFSAAVGINNGYVPVMRFCKKYELEPFAGVRAVVGGVCRLNPLFLPGQVAQAKRLMMSDAELLDLALNENEELRATIARMEGDRAIDAAAGSST